MRIAYVCADRGIELPGESGASVHFGALVRALAAAGIEVDAYCVKGEGDVPGATRTHRLRPVAGATELRAHAAGGPLEQAGKELWSALLNAALVRDLRSAHAARPYDAVLERLSAWSFALPALCRELGLPHLLEVNARVIWEQGRHFGIALEEGAQAAHDYLVASTDHVFTVSEELASQYRQLTAAPVSVLPNGVDTELFAPERRLEPRPPWARGFVAGFVGTLKPFHDLEALASAALLLPDGFCVVVAGVGPGYQALADSEAAAAGRLRLLGGLPHDFVPLVLGWCDAGLATTAPGYRYLSPLKLPEYLASGLPVVVARGAQGDELLDASLKEVYEPGDAESLSKAIVALAVRGGRAKLGPAARAAGVARSWDAVAATVLETASRLKDRPPVPAR